MTGSAAPGAPEDIAVIAPGAAGTAGRKKSMRITVDGQRQAAMKLRVLGTHCADCAATIGGSAQSKGGVKKGPR